MESEESRHGGKQSESNEERDSKPVMIDDEDEITVDEMMGWVDQEEIYRTPTLCQCGGWSSLITINGDEESCGPSFSADSSSTVMAGTDTRSFPSIAAAGASRSWAEEKKGTEMAVESEMGGKTWDGDDEEWLENMIENAMVVAREFQID